MGDDQLEVDEDVRITMSDAHNILREMAGFIGEWAGLPMPLDGYRLQVEERYPYAGIADLYQSEPEPVEDSKYGRLRNSWYSKKRRQWVALFDRRDGGIALFVDPRADYSERLTFWLSTMGASQAWDYQAELMARRKLQTLIPEHMYEMYEMTGSFLETSPRSGVTYVLRRARPTVAIVPLRRDMPDMPMKILACLCLHPIAYYVGTWAGAMVPTDDVVAHLLMIRGDEHYFWRRANQHPLHEASAGL